jgi:hypothetical protein
LVEIPSFFNKADFYSVLLPGYVVIITYLTLFHYDYLFGRAALSFELLSALVFLVAGQCAIGKSKNASSIFMRS